VYFVVSIVSMSCIRIQIPSHLHEKRAMGGADNLLINPCQRIVSNQSNFPNPKAILMTEPPILILLISLLCLKTAAPEPPSREHFEEKPKHKQTLKTHKGEPKCKL
jgi:hypothetical protein